MSQLSPEGRALFRHAQKGLEPTSEARERNASAIAARLGIGAGALAGTLSAASSAAASSAVAGPSLLLLAGKWLVVGLVVGGGLVSGAVAMHGASTLVKPARASVQRALSSSPIAPTAHVSAPNLDATKEAPAAQSGTRNNELALDFKTQQPTPQARPARVVALSANPAPSRPITPSAAPANVSQETALLRRADLALQSGSAATTLQLLDRLAREIPNGVLTEERSAERVAALCQLGRTQQAREEAARFLKATPGSPLTERVKASCVSPSTR
jgi:hypothetical protein